MEMLSNLWKSMVAVVMSDYTQAGAFIVAGGATMFYPSAATYLGVGLIGYGVLTMLRKFIDTNLMK